MENTYHTFQAGEHDYLVLALEWGPRDTVVDWANRIVGRSSAAPGDPDHPRLHVLRRHPLRLGQIPNPKQQWNPHTYGTASLPGGTNDGEQLWQKLVSKHPELHHDDQRPRAATTGWAG